ncbi:Homeotic protein Sex combs reduced [Pseudolycoriella hygida]|uniref:Homeotic protein Sex combs reduced n=1 Tax=Pseudolycoriella hygida TaxID=35572 RepID=A0A9Q0S0U8_9DIPT|nr:Homeotic protein Sex combs reduced [Pseudolycoriella hygida]
MCQCYERLKNFAMSSYQFVNSLASCYPQSQLGHQQNHSSSGNSNNNSNNTGNVQTQSSEFFPASAYTPNLYPSTPQAHYANQAYNLGGQQNSSDMVDYTQLQPQRLHLPNQQQQSAPPSASCKYASDTPAGNNSTSISSPQDLTTARDISPKLSPNSVVENVTRSLNKTSSTTVSSSNSATNHLTSGLNNSVGHTTVPLPMHSPVGDSDTSSESGNEGGGDSQTSSGKKGTPPQIYPWMKRVHLGQITAKKLTIIINIIIDEKFDCFKI